MTLTTDVKVTIGLLAATVLIIGGGAWYASKQPAPQNAQNIPAQEVTEEQQSRLTRDSNPTLGSDKPTVTVVEFGDFQCPACGALHQPLKQVKEDYKDQPVQFVFRHFPLPQHEYANLAAQAAEEANAQDKFWEYHDLLFENQTNLKREDLESYAQQAGLNMEEFNTALDNQTHQDTVTQDRSDAAALGVNSTPTLFINNTKYTGTFAPEQLKQAIETALQE